MIGKRVERGEDRLCSTAMAINTLLYTWMEGDRWVPSVPSLVKDLVGNASLWLAKNVKQGKAYNVVFSGSVKSSEVRYNTVLGSFCLFVTGRFSIGSAIFLPCESAQVSKWFSCASWVSSHR